jgi:hypothetical protein
VLWVCLRAAQLMGGGRKPRALCGDAIVGRAVREMVRVQGSWWKVEDGRGWAARVGVGGAQLRHAGVVYLISLC